MTTASRLAVDVRVEDLRLKKPFRISGYVFESTPVVVATVTRRGVRGRGEAAGVYYLEDTPAKAASQLQELAPRLDDGLTREALQRLLPPGAARNALDCALWELEARERGVEVATLAGLPAVRPLLTTVTLGAEDPAVMADGASALGYARALKLKLTGDTVVDIARVRAVRAARPDVWLGVDANQGFTPETLAPLLPVLLEARVQLLEQPFRRGREAELDGLRLPLPVAADESCLHLGELDALRGRFDVVNIKLDKCGGLTEGLAIAKRAQALGLKVMVGNMLGTSLSVGPGFVLGQLCDVVDLDGPLFIAADPPPTVRYDDGYLTCPPEVWGPRAVIPGATG
ncbi:MAG: dipeptide epimerase [Proteobacteria bacterium]|nr:dipeptide epimerase [Pseudomonadota bacterium]